jgi:hypothetical protein
MCSRRENDTGARELPPANILKAKEFGMITVYES